MSTELRVWCFPITALSTRSKSAKRSCTNGWRFSTLSGKEQNTHTHTRKQKSINQIQTQCITFRSSGYQWSVHLDSTCMVLPPPTSPPTESVVAPRLSGNKLPFLLSRGHRARRKKRVGVFPQLLCCLSSDVRPTRVPMMNDVRMFSLRGFRCFRPPVFFANVINAKPRDVLNKTGSLCRLSPNEMSRAQGNRSGEKNLLSKGKIQVCFQTKCNRHTVKTPFIPNTDQI